MERVYGVGKGSKVYLCIRGGWTNVVWGGLMAVWGGLMAVWRWFGVVWWRFGVV